MTVEELSELANKNEPMPENLALHDILLYQCLRNIYQQFHDGKMDLQAAQKEKGRILYQHKIYERQQKTALEMARHYQKITIATEGIKCELRKMLHAQEEQKNALETAKRLIDVWDGLEHV